MLSILEYVSTCRAITTHRAYRLALASFIECMYGVPRERYQRTQDQMVRLDVLSRQYLTEDRDRADDMIRYLQAHKSLSPKALRVRVEAVKLWLEYNDIEIPKAKLKRILGMLPRARAITKDQDLTTDIIRSMSEHMSLPGRAIIMTLMSSGMRIGEVLAIKISDIDLSISPAEVHLPADITKTKLERYTFVSSETVTVIKEWLKNRHEWVQASINRGGAIGMQKNLHDDRVFPFSASTVSKMIIRGLQKSGYYEKDIKSRRSRITAHSFRKFFISQLKTAMPAEMVELLAGHSGYLSDAYRRYPIQQVRDAYLQAEYAVCLNSPVNVQEIKRNSDAISALSSENARLQARLQGYESGFDARVKDLISEVVAGADWIDQNMDLIKKKMGE